MEGGGGRTSSGDGSVRPMGGQQQRGPGKSILFDKSYLEI